MESRLRPSPLPLQGLLASLRLWPWPLQMPRSGLKQVWVLPTAIAQLWVEEGTATHCSILAWEIPRMEEPGGLQSIGLQRVRHD